MTVGGRLSLVENLTKMEKKYVRICIKALDKLCEEALLAPCDGEPFEAKYSDELDKLD